MRGIATPVHSVATAQLSDGFPGEASNLRGAARRGGEPGRRVSRERLGIGMKMRRGKEGRDLCNGVDVYPRQWINIGIRRGRNDLIPDFNPGFYPRLDIPDYTIVAVALSFTSFSLFIYRTREGCQEPETELSSIYFLPFLPRIKCFLALEKNLISGLLITRVRLSLVLYIFLYVNSICCFILLLFHHRGFERNIVSSAFLFYSLKYN